MKFIPGLPVTVIPPESDQCPPLPPGYAGQKIVWTCSVDRSLAFELENGRVIRIGPLDTQPLAGGSVRMGVNFGELLPGFVRPPAAPRDEALNARVVGKTLDRLYLVSDAVAVEIEDLEVKISLYGVVLSKRENPPRPS